MISLIIMGRLDRYQNLFFICALYFYWFSLYVYSTYFVPHLTSLGITATVTGIITGAYGIMQLLLRIPMSAISDSIKKPKAVLIGLICILILSGCFLAFLGNEFGFFMGRFLAGVAATCWTIMTSLGVKYYIRLPATQAMGRLIAYQYTGMTSSYLIGSLAFSTLGINSLFLLSIFSAVLCLISVILLPVPENRSASGNFNIPVRIGQTVKHVPLLLFSVLYLIVQLVHYATALSFTNNYASSVLSISPVGLGVSSFILGIGSLIAGLMIGRDIENKFGLKRIVYFSFLLQMFYCIIMPYNKSVAVLFVLQSLCGLSYGALTSLLTGLAIKDIPQNNKTVGMGVFQATYCLGMIFGPIIMGRILDISSYKSAFLIMGCIICIDLLYACFLFHRRDSTY